MKIYNPQLATMSKKVKKSNKAVSFKQEKTILLSIAFWLQYEGIRNGKKYWKRMCGEGTIIRQGMMKKKYPEFTKF